MLNYNTHSNSDEQPDDYYPDFFYEWDKAVRTGKKPGFFEPDELTDIIEIYIIDNDLNKAKQAINYALSIYSDDDDLFCDILMLLDDHELWNDLLNLCEQYKNIADVWSDGHKLTALLHLGMEDETFLFFRKLKTKYAEDAEALGTVYVAMGESLLDIDLFDSCNEVMQEAIRIIGEEIDFFWLQLQAYVSLEDSEKVLESAEKIQKISPLDGETWHRLGNAFQKIGDWERAIDAFEYALSLEFESKENLINLIHAYDHNGNPGKSLERIKEYLNRYHGTYSLNFIAAKICSQLEDWSQALKFINEAIKIEPTINYSSYICKSVFLLNLGEYRKAKMALMEGIENTNDPEGDLKKELFRLNEQYPDF